MFVDNLNVIRKKVSISIILKYVDNNKIIEIGSDDGYIANVITQHDSSVDLSLVDLSDYRSYCKDLDFIEIDVSQDELPFKDNSVDMIVSTQVIEHLENITFFMAECSRVLKKNGVLVVSFPNYSNLYQRIRFFFTGTVMRLDGQLGSGGHINFTPYKALSTWLEPKFKLLEIKGDFIVFFYIQKIIKFITFGRVDKNVLICNSSPLFSWNVNMVFMNK